MQHERHGLAAANLSHRHGYLPCLDQRLRQLIWIHAVAGSLHDQPLAQLSLTYSQIFFISDAVHQELHLQCLTGVGLNFCPVILVVAAGMIVVIFEVRIHLGLHDALGHRNLESCQ